MILPNITSTGLIGMDKRLSMVPRSISRVTDSAVKISMVMGRMVPTRPGTMFSREAAGGLNHYAERGERRARRDRVGGIGRNQQRRMLAAPDGALEAARNLDAEE